jgi:transposase
MSTTRRRFTASMKATVALEAIKGQRTLNEIATTYGVHPTQVAVWKKQVLEQAPTLFTRPAATAEAAAQQERLYEEIGRLTVELDWLKKKWGHAR